MQVVLFFGRSRTGSTAARTAEPLTVRGARRIQGSGVVVISDGRNISRNYPDRS